MQLYISLIPRCRESLGTRLASLYEVTNNKLFYHSKTYRTYQRKFFIKLERLDVVFVNLFLASSFLFWLQETEHQYLTNTTTTTYGCMKLN